jgi:signal transduction histidine kinase
MKFWQKSFFCIIAVFLLGFDVMGYILAERSYALNRDYALAAAEREQQVIQKSVFESISLSENSFSELNPENLKLTISPYADFYRNQGIYFQLYQDNTLAFNNLPVVYNEKFSVLSGEQHTEIKEIDRKLYCFITAYLDAPYTNLQLVYIRDMQSLSQFKAQIIQTYTTISVSVSLILAVVMLFLLIGLTKPFRRLNAVAAEISMGHYDKRVTIKSHDEIGDFAKSFNLMADHIQGHIAELSGMTENKQRFIDNLAHETRTPITAILGYGELLKYANCSEAEKETAINHIISQSKRIQNMVYKLMDLAYIGRENIEMRPVVLTNLLRDVEAALNSRIQEKHINMHMMVQPITISGDTELIESLLINLLDNAVKASNEGGIIEIRTHPEAGGASIEIIDYGKGMDKGEIAKVIEPFYRVDKSRSRSQGGAGLGLALCARICEIHHASLYISSEIGKGTTVKISFTTL